MIVIEQYQNKWPQQFEIERESILCSIPILDKATIHHIGSTSVAGLAAKPIIDILIEIKNLNELDTYSRNFELLGYECMGEFGISMRRFYRKGKPNRTHHIHAFSTGSIGIRRHIAFRDYLRTNQAIADEYAALKRAVAISSLNDIDKYCDGKHEFVSKHEALALQWLEDKDNGFILE